MPTAVDCASIDRLMSMVGDKYLLLLLAEDKEAPKAKAGIPSLSYRVLGELTSERGPLDEALAHWSSDRPSVMYRRLLMDRNDTEAMVKIGVAWLPQVRLMRRGRVLFRSSVAVGDNGNFIAQDVGGKSFIRRNGTDHSKLVNLLDALTAETDRKIL